MLFLYFNNTPQKDVSTILLGGVSLSIWKRTFKSV